MPKMLKMGNGTHSLTPWGGDKYHWNQYGEADLRNLVNLLGHFFLLDGSSIYMWTVFTLYSRSGSNVKANIVQDKPSFQASWWCCPTTTVAP